MMPSAPMSSTGLIRTGSFQRTRTMLAVSLPLVAMMCACTVSSDIALCSMSIQTKSDRPHKASVIVGSVHETDVPMHTCPLLILSLNFFAFSICSLVGVELPASAAHLLVDSLLRLMEGPLQIAEV